MSDLDNLAGAVTEAFLDVDADENITDAINRLARAIRDLGNADAATPMGGMEALGKAMQDSADTLAGAIDRLASAIECHQS